MGTNMKAEKALRSWAGQMSFNSEGQVRVTVERDEKWFTVVAEDGQHEVVSQGKTLSSALRNLAEAVWLSEEGA